MKRISKEQIIEKCNQLGVKYVNHYIGNVYGSLNTRVQFECYKHNEKGLIDIDWGHFNSSAKGCPYCAGKHKTTNDFTKEISNNIILTSNYDGLYNKIKCKCKICGYEWETTPDYLKRNSNCVKCASVARINKNGEKLIKQLKKINPNIIILSKYIGYKSKIKCSCLIHNCIWESYIGNLLNKSATCPECSAISNRQKSLLSENEFQLRLHKLRNDIETLEKYNGFNENIKCKCKIHDCEFLASPRYLLRGLTKCKQCKLDFMSSGERQIAEYLNELNIDYTFQKIFKDCKNKNPLRFDFYIKNKNLTIEYDGEQHFNPMSFNFINKKDGIEEFNENKLRDKIKDDYCSKMGIEMLRIPYWEKTNIKNIIKEKLCS